MRSQALSTTPRRRLMEETLTPLDATFLELEQQDQSAHMHIGAVLTMEPPADGSPPSFDAVREHLRGRLERLPRFAQRLSEADVGGLSWPRWLDDERFELSDHVLHATLPAPGSEAELRDWASAYYAQRLDRARPLWEMVVVDGLIGNRWAIATKTHHSMVDGVGSVDIGHLMLDAEPQPDALGSAAATSSAHVGAAPRQHHRQAEPGIRDRGVAAVGQFGSLSLGTVRWVVGAVRNPSRAAGALRKSAAAVRLLVADELIASPQTSLNDPIGAGRRLGWTRASLAEMKGIRSALGGTVNDVVLALAAGAFRRLLLARGERIDAPGLRAMVPVNVRTDSDSAGAGNRITSLFIHLPVDEPDARARYDRQVAEAEALKTGTQASGSQALIDLTSVAPPALHGLLARSLYARRLFNVTITNVPGPQMPLYALGSTLREIWPLVPLAAEHAVALAVISYNGSLFFCLNADRASMPDLDILTQGIDAELAELRRLSE